RLIGWLAKVLAEHPDQRRIVREDRSLLTRTVDETLRFEPTGPHVARWMARDFECYGTTVPAGSAMLLLFGAANRDPRRYQDPDPYNTDRENRPHVPCGRGVHSSRGATPPGLGGRFAWHKPPKRGPEGDTVSQTPHPAPPPLFRGGKGRGLVLPCPPP